MAQIIAPGAAFTEALHQALLEQEERKQRDFMNQIRLRQTASTEEAQRFNERLRTDQLKDLAHSREAAQAKASFEETPRGMELPSETQELYKRHNLPFMQEPGTLPSKQMAGVAALPSTPTPEPSETLGGPPVEPAAAAPAPEPAVPTPPSMKTTESPSATGKATALGSPKERATAEVRQMYNEAGAAIKGVQNRSEAVDILLSKGFPPQYIDDVINAKLGKQAEMEPVMRITRSGQMVPVIDTRTGQPAMQPKGTHYAPEPAPQQPQMVLIQTVDANGRPVQRVVPKTAGAEFPMKPSATTESRLASAQAVNQTGEDLIRELSDPKFAAVVGPAMGRYNNLQDFIGNPPPEFSELAGTIESYALANMGVHGMRSTQGAEKIKTLLSAKHTPESLIKAITGLNRFSTHFMENEGRNPQGRAGGGGGGTVKYVRDASGRLVPEK